MRTDPADNSDVASNPTAPDLDGLLDHVLATGAKTQMARSHRGTPALGWIGSLLAPKPSWPTSYRQTVASGLGGSSRQRKGMATTPGRVDEQALSFADLCKERHCLALSS
jgi:hypothetical protein